jgi:predicted permease
MYAEALRQDLRYASRSLRRTPGVTTAALIVLTLTIGATTAIFSVANGVLFRPLPLADPGRLVLFNTMGVLDFQNCREQSGSFESIVYYSVIDKSLQDTTEPERIAAIAAERGLFDLLGVRPLAGRTFSANDSTKVAVVSEGFWRRRFDGKPSLTDWKITLDGEPYTVVGIMPEHFQFPYRTTMTEVWIPTELPHTANRFQRIDVAVGRLKSDVTIDAARAELRTIAQRLEKFYPQAGNLTPITITPLAEVVVGRSRTALLTLLGAVAMVLLIACANVTNLLLARSEARKHEVAVRTALGAGRGRLLRQFLTESILLSLSAGVAAVFIAVWGTSLLVTLAGTQIPRSFEIGLDWTVFLFLLSVSVATGVAVGLVPALQATRASISGVLLEPGSRSSGSRRSAAMNKGLVVAEIALALVLLIGAGLLLRGFLHLAATPTGVVADNVLTLRMDIRGLLARQAPAAGTTARTVSAEGQYFGAIEERVRHIPGVRAAGFVTVLPIERAGFVGSFAIAGRPIEGVRPTARLREVTPGYFRALGIPLRAGRLFTDREPGIVVNETLARQLFPGQDSIGRVLDRGTIIGVVGDVRQRIRLQAEPEIYSPLARTGYSAATLVVTAAIPLESLVGPVRAAIRQVNPNQAVYNVRTLDDVIAASRADLDLFLWLIGLFAGLALVLSMVGIYGIMSYAVASRRKEFGIRLALGADSARLLRMVLAQGGMMIGAGLTIGIAVALVLTRYLRAQLYEITPTDPMTFGVVSLVLAVVAFAACFNPARRAMKTDPSTALRYE